MKALRCSPCAAKADVSSALRAALISEGSTGYCPAFPLCRESCLFCFFQFGFNPNWIQRRVFENIQQTGNCWVPRLPSETRTPHCTAPRGTRSLKSHSPQGPCPHRPQFPRSCQSEGAQAQGRASRILLLSPTLDPMNAPFPQEQNLLEHGTSQEEALGEVKASHETTRPHLR